jgi:hypothetical protein
MWCVPRLDEQYITRMEDLLDLYELPENKREPVICIDERPVVLHDSVRQETTARPGKIARKDYEYKRCGTANVFCIVAPKSGQNLTYASVNRKRPAFAEAMKRIAQANPRAKTIHVVMDNLNTHNEKSLVEAFGARRGSRLWKRFTVHYTPPHASWLNQAEIGISLWSRECLGKRRIPSFQQLEQQTASWTSCANAEKRTIEWRFTSRKARKRFGYKKSTRPRSKH